MKPILFSLLIGLVATQTVSAQKFEIGLNAGASYATGFLNKQNGDFSNGRPAPIKRRSDPALSVKVLSNVGKWQFGVATGFYGVSGRHLYFNPGVETYLPPPNGLGPVVVPIEYMKFKYIPIQVLANRKVQLGKIQAYAGLSAGMVMITSVTRSYDAQNWTKTNEHSANYTCGAQLGASYPLRKRIAVNAEVAGNLVSVSPQYYTCSLPATIGVRYRFLDFIPKKSRIVPNAPEGVKPTGQ